MGRQILFTTLTVLACSLAAPPAAKTEAVQSAAAVTIGWQGDQTPVPDVRVYEAE